MNGFELAREEINGSSRLGGASIAFIFESSRGTEEGAVEAFNKLIHEDLVFAILGPAMSNIRGDSGFPPRAGKSGRGIQFHLGRPRPERHRRFHLPGRSQPGCARAWRRRADPRKAGIPAGGDRMVDELDFFARSSDEALRSALTDAGVEILPGETFETRDTTFVDQLTRIEALNPEAIFVSAIWPADRIRILVEGRQLGIPFNIPFVVPELTVDEVRSAGDAAEGAITFAGWVRTAATPGNQEFVERYQARFGTDPNHWSAQSYAALNILATAIGNAGSTDPRAIRDKLAGIRNLDTILGRFSFNADGDAVYEPIVLIARDFRRIRDPPMNNSTSPKNYRRIKVLSL